MLILFERVLSDICNAVITGVNVKLSSFGNFFLRSKGERVGRNPRTGVEVPIEKRRVMLFKPSHVLKAYIDGGVAEAKTNQPNGLEHLLSFDCLACHVQILTVGYLSSIDELIIVN